MESSKEVWVYVICDEDELRDQYGEAFNLIAPFSYSETKEDAIKALANELSNLDGYPITVEDIMNIPTRPFRDVGIEIVMGGERSFFVYRLTKE